ncbi:amidohydrolase family protein [Ichthyenterobacterium magnum]|uniref:Imidazolonepropionase-like amidohydrolase n=1 Tax=Ichthyenterobacterium magnum TaxID=1230530 RepID=A0A420DKQ7_9FLAO|nr:amidohydrolase family protein [Ichthyenterobacterium magnum]RKE94799.1 imidazolonepropionase-like amidohydrolase [Ichthyenterobacterium magnum]
MKKNLAIMAIISLTLLLSCSKTKFSNEAFIMYHANIIDVENGKTLKDKAIIIDSGLIKRIGDFKNLKSLVSKNKHYNVDHKYVIPGLWDMHSHIDQLSDDFEHSKSMLSLYTLNGVTSIREMGGNWTKIKQLREASKESHYSPTILTAGPILENKAFVDWVAKVDNDPEFKKNRVRIANASEVEKVVDSVKKLGVDFLKIRTAATKEVFFEIMKQAKAKGLKLSGHVDKKVDLYDAVKSGISSLEHLDILQLPEMSDAKMDSIVLLMKELKTGYSPTLIYFKNHRIYDRTKIKSFLNDSTYSNFPKRAYASKSLLKKSKLSIKRSEGSQVPWNELETNFMKFATKIVQNNVSVLASTDGANALVLPGFSLHEELQLYKSELKMSPLQILQSATINPSKYFGFESKLGLVKEGYVADLIVLDKNPLLNIKNTETINSVIKSGKLISNKEILKELKSIRDYNKTNN